MARLQRKDLSKPDEVRSFGLGHVEIFDMDDVVVGKTVFEPGWRWSEQVKQIAGTDLCEYHHLGFTVSGRFHIIMKDGTEMEFGPNMAFEIPSGHDAWVVGDEPYVTLDFAGMRSFARAVAGSGERVLTTLLMTDIVDSTLTAERVGDSNWRDLLARHNERVRFELDRFRGREVTTTGDGFLALFDSPERAVRCADAVCSASADLGLMIRAGIHTGEVELVPNNVRGVAAHTVARIVALAEGGEILISSTTRDLLAGAAVTFEDRGSHELKGLSGTRAIYAARPVS